MMETNKSIGGRPRDSFTDPHVVRVEDLEGHVIAKKCIYCDHRFSIKTSVTRIKAHLGGVSGQDVALCIKVPSTVKEAAKNAMPRSSTSSRLSKMMCVGPTTPNVPRDLSHTPRKQPLAHQNSNSALHQPQHTLTALQEMEHLLFSSPKDGENHFGHDMLTAPEFTHHGLSQFAHYDVFEDPERLEPATNSLNHMGIETQQTYQHGTSEDYSLTPHQPEYLLTEVQQEVPKRALYTSQPNELCSMHDLALQYPMQQHLGEDPNCLPYQIVQEDAVTTDSIHDATIPQDFLQEGAYPNILSHFAYQEDIPVAEFERHEGLMSRHHMQENLQGDERICFLDHYPYPSIEPQLHHRYIDPLLESLNAPKCTSDQAMHERKRKFLDKSPPIGKKLSLATTFQGPTFNKKVSEICTSLEDDFVSRIGVYGMGGSGKTTIVKHIYNLLLEEYFIPFTHVIWVTVSQDHTITKLQRHLASQFNIILSCDDDEVARAASLYEGMQNKCYALILDDIWDKVNLEQVGIPEPSRDNGCKLIVTTRSLDVCRRMQCKAIFLDLLSGEEAWGLFVKTLVAAPKNSIIESIMKEVAKECARLPLAIVTIAGSMRGIFDVHEWKYALHSLRKRTLGFNDMEKEVIEKLKFSYYRLSKQLQECLLVCTLYPEDYRINKVDLIRLLISEGTIGNTESLSSAYDYGYTILNKLENACLLMHGSINVFDEVVMHDLVRDMCLDIVGGRFLVKCRSEFPPIESKYTEDVEKVSLVGSEFEEIPSHIVPYCPKLSTLLLSENRKLTRISCSFFTGLLSLKVLDLSYTSIHELPNSVTNLVSLDALVLEKCLELRRLPCLAPLKALKKLDLYGSGIEEAPEGLGELVHLTYLNLEETEIRTLPRLIIRNLVKLQHLQIGWIEIMIDDVKELKNLELFQATFAELEEFNEYVSLLLSGKQGPAIYGVGVSCGLMSYSIFRNIEGTTGISLYGGNKINGTKLMFPKDVEIIIYSPEFIETLYIDEFRDHCHVLPNLVRGTTSSLHMLPIRLHHEEKTKASGQSKGLFDVESLLVFSNLKSLFIRYCSFMEELVSISPSVGVFISSLEIFEIAKCDKLVRLLDPKILSCFQNLEYIRIDACGSLESIISAANPIEKESDNAISFPRLRHLVLADLQNLRSICEGTLICPSIETIHVRRCPKLKKLSLQLPVLDDNSGQSLPLQSSLAIICGEPTWWGSLEWDHPHAKALLRPYFKPCLHCYTDDDPYSAGRAAWPFYSQFHPDLA